MPARKNPEPLADLPIMDHPVLKGLDLIISASDRTIAHATEGVEKDEAVSSEGRDGVADFEGTTYRFREKDTDRKGRVRDKTTAALEVRVYPELDLAAVQVSCSVHSGELIPDGSVRIEFDSIPGLKSLLALYMFSDWWSRPHFDSDLSKLPDRTQMLLWQTEDGSYGCIVPLVSGGFKCDLNSRTGRPGADLSSNEAGRSECEAAAFAVGVGADPFELVQRCCAAGMTVSGRPGKLRWEKEYPEFLEYIGWCTWDALYHNQNERDILTKLRAFKKAKFPVRFLLIDDGWSPVKDGGLTSLDADRKKFPRGLAPLVEDARDRYGVWWVGVWHTFNAYWRGIAKDSEAYCQTKEYLFQNKRGMVIPYPDAAKGFGFWHAWHSFLRDQGISFVKVDNQGSIRSNTRYAMPIGEAAKGEQYALQASVDLNFGGWMINCMCMTNEIVWHWINSNVSRNSDDFFPKNPASAVEHARQNCYNNLFYASFSWPDWDMWWSDHPRAEYHAAMRAVSGGPIYISDAVDSSDFDVLRPLIFSDGKILRCDDPALPTRDCLFANPKENPVPVKVWNTAGEAGILAAFNVTDGEQIVRGSMKPSDVEAIHLSAAASAEAEGQRFAVREFFSSETRVLGEDEAWDFELEPYGQKLFSMVPIEEGVAVVGLIDKYISPAAVQAEFRTRDSLAVELYEGGDFLAYCDDKPKSVTLNGSRVKYAYDNGWLSMKSRPGQSAVVTISF